MTILFAGLDHIAVNVCLSPQDESRRSTSGTVSSPGPS